MLNQPAPFSQVLATPGPLQRRTWLYLEDLTKMKSFISPDPVWLVGSPWKTGRWHPPSGYSFRTSPRPGGRWGSVLQLPVDNQWATQPEGQPCFFLLKIKHHPVETIERIYSLSMKKISFNEESEKFDCPLSFHQYPQSKTQVLVYDVKFFSALRTKIHVL